MRRSWALTSIFTAMFLSLLLVSAVFAGPQAPEGYRDIRLGMTKPQILDILKKEPATGSFEEIGDEIGEIIRNDNLFRFAAYKFDPQGALVEIDLQMREILGRDKVLELFNAKYGLNVSPTNKYVDSNRSVEVQDNVVIIKLASDNRKRSAKSQ
ncbi:MAG: hypothetical protein ACP5U1_16110 [Desulfomonilaceae bacterium]